MAKTRAQKEQEIALLQSWLSEATLVILADHRGLTVAQMNELRGKLREAGARARVIKNTLFRIAADRVGLEGVEEVLRGSLTAVFVEEDLGKAAKAVKDFYKETDLFPARALILEGKVYGPEMLDQVAALPTKEELLAQVVGGFQAPIRGLVYVLAGTLRGLVNVLDARRRQLEEAA